jgi:hypothetical protein
MIHILEQNHIPFELKDTSKETVDIIILEKDASGNIFFPQIFQFVHDLHKWVFVATSDNIVEWNDAGTLHSHLTTPPHAANEAPPAVGRPEWTKRTGRSDYMSLISNDEPADLAPADVSPPPHAANEAPLSVRRPEWAKRTGLSDYISLIQSDKPADGMSADVHPLPEESLSGGGGGGCPGEVAPDTKHTHARPTGDVTDDGTREAYQALLIKFASLESQSKQAEAKYQEDIAQLERATATITTTFTTANQELQNRLDEQKRTHVKSEQALFLEKRRLETELNTLRTKVVELARTIEQQDGEIKTYDQIVETSQETIVMHERTKQELIKQMHTHETRIAELLHDAQQREQTHATSLHAQAQQHATEMAFQQAHADEALASANAQVQTLTDQVGQLQAVVDAIRPSLDAQTNVARDATAKVDELQLLIETQRHTIERLHAEKEPRVDSNEVDVRVGDLDARFQLLQLCRLQNDKERILISHLSSLFLP